MRNWHRTIQLSRRLCSTIDQLERTEEIKTGFVEQSVVDSALGLVAAPDGIPQEMLDVIWTKRQSEFHRLAAETAGRLEAKAIAIASQLHGELELQALVEVAEDASPAN